MYNDRVITIIVSMTWWELTRGSSNIKSICSHPNILWGWPLGTSWCGLLTSTSVLLEQHHTVCMINAKKTIRVWIHVIVIIMKFVVAKGSLSDKMRKNSSFLRWSTTLGYNLNIKKFLVTIFLRKCNKELRIYYKQIKKTYFRIYLIV